MRRAFLRWRSCARALAAGRVDEERILALVERVQFSARAAPPICGDCFKGLERTTVSIVATNAKIRKRVPGVFAALACWGDGYVPVGPDEAVDERNIQVFP